MTTRIHTGKSKNVYSTSNPDEVIIEFTDRITDKDGLVQAEVDGKGPLLCEISKILFESVNRAGIPHHFLAVEGDRIMRVRRTSAVRPIF